MANTETNYLEDAKQLDNLLGQLSSENNELHWNTVESTARNLANGLRVKDGPEDKHTALGKSQLPQTLTSLLKTALGGSATPSQARTGVVLELLRVAANLCMDHDENRGHLLEAGLPQEIVSLLEGYAESIPSIPSETPLPLSISNLKVIRNAIGVLLNASVDYDPVKTRLTSLEAVTTILKLSVAIYPPGSWVTSSFGEATPDAVNESWALRSGLSNWAWRAISELKEDSTQVFNQAILTLLVPAIRAFTPPYAEINPASPFASPSALRTSLLKADFDCLEESCMFLESLSLDVEEFRLILARGFHSPKEHDGVPCLSSMLTFVEKGTYPPLWNKDASADMADSKRAFDICKAAMIKVIVEVSGEEKNENILWVDQVSEKPGGGFVFKMIEWITRYITSREASPKESSRDDMVICATLSLGNLARGEKQSTALLSAPHALAPVLCSSFLLGPDSDIKVKHGVTGLLKHLAQSSTRSPDNIAALGNAGVMEQLTKSKIWEGPADPMNEVVQVGAIGVVKHLCNGNIDNATKLVLSEGTPGLKQILDLVARSDSIRVKSEGTRVLVNVVKSLCSDSISTTAPSPQDSETIKRLKEEAMNAILTDQCAMALARLVGRSTKYHILINEGVVALSLMGTNRQGALLVTRAILETLPAEVGPEGSEDNNSATKNLPERALDVLVNVLSNISSQVTGGHTVSASDFALEIGANVCALLTQISKGNTTDEISTVKDTTRPILETLAKNELGHGKEGMVCAAAKKALDTWETQM